MWFGGSDARQYRANRPVSAPSDTVTVEPATTLSNYYCWKEGVPECGDDVPGVETLPMQVPLSI